MSTEKSKSDIGNRIFSVRKHLGLIQKDFAEKVGISPNFLSDVERSTSPPSRTLLIAISLRYSINYDWLLTGDGEMFSKGNTGCSLSDRITVNVLLTGEWKTRPEIDLDDYYAAPLVTDRIAAGYGREIRELDREDYRNFVWVYSPALSDRRSHRLVALEVDGESMMPTIYHGDIVLVDIDDPGRDDAAFLSGRIYAVRIGKDSGCAVKRVYAGRTGFVLASDNPSFAPTISEEAETIGDLIIGRVVWGWRNLLSA